MSDVFNGSLCMFSGWELVALDVLSL